MQAVDMGDSTYVIVNRSVGKLCTGNCLAADGFTPPSSSTILAGGMTLPGSDAFWRAGEYGACSSTCGAGVAARSVICVDGSGELASGCDQSGKPATSEACTDVSSCTYAWATDSFSACNTSCGTGQSSRTVSCRRSDGTSVDDSYCSTAGAKPVATQACSDISTCGYSWSVSQYGACAAGCTDSSSQTRLVACMRGDNTAVNDSFCAGLGAKPAISQSCPSYSSCVAPAATISGNAVTYTQATNFYTPSITGNAAVCSWDFGNGLTGTGCIAQSARWSTAGSYLVRLDMTGVNSLQSGSAQKAVTVFSAVSANFAAPTPLVAGVPAAFTSSSTGDVAGCTWDFGDGVTASTCAPSHSFAVAVARAVKLTVAGLGGDTATKSLSLTPITASWAAGSFAACTPACSATSSQTRNVACTGSDASSLDDGYCVNAGVKPALSQACADYSTCSYSWSQGGFGSCTTTCGTGTQAQTVTCQRGDGTTMPDASCSGQKPDASQSCTVYSGCAAPTASIVCTPNPSYTGASVTCTPTLGGNYASCSWNFGDGYTVTGCSPQAHSFASKATFTVEMDVTGTNSLQTVAATKGVQVFSAVAANFAVSSPLVAGIAATFTSTSTGDVASCAWDFGDGTTASTCTASHSFADATQRTVKLTVTGKGGDTSIKSLSVTPLIASWVSGAYGSCTAACSASSSQTRSVTCIGSDSSTLADAYCASAGAKPATNQTCADYTACTYSWVQTGYGTCQYLWQPATVSCQRSDGTTVADSYCNAGTKPATQKGCNGTASIDMWNGFSWNSAHNGNTTAISWNSGNGVGAHNTACSTGCNSYYVQTAWYAGWNIPSGTYYYTVKGFRDALGGALTLYTQDSSGVQTSVYVSNSGAAQQWNTITSGSFRVNGITKLLFQVSDVTSSWTYFQNFYLIRTGD